MPKPLEEFRMVDYYGTVVAIGGLSGTSDSDALYKLICTDLTYEWQKMRQTLSGPRRSFVAMTIPDEWTDCIIEAF